jgi:hypothetical protein
MSMAAAGGLRGPALAIIIPIGSGPREVANAQALAARLCTALDTLAPIPEPTRGPGTVQAFVTEQCERRQDYVETASDLFDAYARWARRAKSPPLSGCALGRALTSLGFKRKKSNTVHYVGLRLRPPRGGRKR